MGTEVKDINLLVPVQVPLARIDDLLVGAVEGGSNYWAGFTLTQVQTACRKASGTTYVGVRVTELRADGIEGSRRILNAQALTEGLSTMQSKYPRHFGNFLSEDDDAETSDVFVQCCLFGEIVYG